MNTNQSCTCAATYTNKNIIVEKETISLMHEPAIYRVVHPIRL